MIICLLSFNSIAVAFQPISKIIAQMRILKRKEEIKKERKKKFNGLFFHIIAGASKEIGTALTRVCLRHKAVETRMKSFTTAIMDCLILPLQVHFNSIQKMFFFLIQQIFLFGVMIMQSETQR